MPRSTGRLAGLSSSIGSSFNRRLVMPEAHSERPTSATWLLERRCPSGAGARLLGSVLHRPGNHRAGGAGQTAVRKAVGFRRRVMHCGTPRPAEDCRMVPAGDRMGPPGSGSTVDHRRPPTRGDAGPREHGDQISRLVAAVRAEHAPGSSRRLPRRRILRSFHDRDVPGEGTSPARDWRGCPSRWHNAPSDGQT